jgi:CCR4-NOT transcription complex subunit 9
MLWHSFGCIAALLQEVISVYQAINPPTLTVSNYFKNTFLLHDLMCYFVFKAHMSNRICNALALVSKNFFFD